MILFSNRLKKVGVYRLGKVGENHLCDIGFGRDFMGFKYCHCEIPYTVYVADACSRS
jgi:hypothetical protein